MEQGDPKSSIGARSSELDSFGADRLAEDWDGGQPRRDDDTVSGRIGRFNPRDVPTEIWAQVEDIARRVVEKADPVTPYMAIGDMGRVAQLLCWTYRVGQPLDEEVVFTPDFIARYLDEGLAHLSEGTRINYRTVLWDIGRVVVGPELFPPKAIPGKRSPLTAPYSDAEITDIVSWTRGLPTLHMRRNVRALLAIVLGAGATSEELQRAAGSDVRKVGDGVVIDLLGKSARAVPVFTDWAEDLFELAMESGERGVFCPGRKRITRRDVIGFIERCSVDDKAKFCVQRLRINWIVRHLSEGTHPLVLEQISGISFPQLAKYLRFASLPDDYEGISVPPPPEDASTTRAQQGGRRR